MKNILVTGGAGYIGGVLTDILVAKGHTVTVYDGLLYEERFSKNVPFIFGDIRDTEKLISLHSKYDEIIWLAALVGDGACAQDPKLTYEVNYYSLKRFLDKTHRRIIYPSTCSVYGAQDGVLTEESPTNPLSVYAETKLLGEKLVLENGGLAFRLGTLFGVGDNYSRLRLDLVINVLAYKALVDKKITVFGGEQWRPILAVSDVAEYFSEAVTRDYNDVFNLSRKNVRIKDLAEIYKNIIPDLTVEIIDAKFEDLRNYQVSTEKVDKKFIFTPKISIESEVHRMIDLLHERRIKNPLDPVYYNTHFVKATLDKILAFDQGSGFTAHGNVQERRPPDQPNVRNQRIGSAMPKHFSIWIVSPPNYLHSRSFEEMALGLQAAFAALGYDAPIVTDPAQAQDYAVVLGTNLLPTVPKEDLPPRMILYNLEQIPLEHVQRTTPRLNPDYIDLLRHYPIWDYSARNIDYLKDYGITNVTLCNIGYMPALTRIAPAQEEDIDVLFVGSISPRRLVVLQQLIGLGKNVHVGFNVYGPERDALIARAKVVLNLHYYEDTIFERVRVSYLLANRKCVVSETGADPALEEPFRDGVAFAPYDQIVDTCMRLLERNDERIALAEKGFACFAALPQAPMLEEALDFLDLAHEEESETGLARKAVRA